MCPRFSGWSPVEPGDLVVCMSTRGIELWLTDEAGEDTDTRLETGKAQHEELGIAIEVQEDRLRALFRGGVGWAHRVWFKRAFQ